MIPATSCPGTRGYWIPGKSPSFVTASLWQTPEACTRMRTWPAPGSGISRSTIWYGPLALTTWAARIFGIESSSRSVRAHERHVHEMLGDEPDLFFGRANEVRHEQVVRAVVAGFRGQPGHGPRLLQDDLVGVEEP